MSEEALAKVTRHDDGHFVRTAVIVPDEGVSFELVDTVGVRIAEINAFVYYSFDPEIEGVAHLIVDVIDKDDLYPKKFALTFNNGTREFTNTDGNLVCADFRKE